MTEAELLFTEVLNCSRAKLYLDKKRRLNQQEASFLAGALKRRFYGQPIQYILGETEFMGLEFRVNSGVFIPRPETEILVQTTINIVKLLDCQTVKLLDIGTGCGNIAISLAKFLPNTKITATDISEKALEIAKQNALLNNVDINFLQSNLFSNYGLWTMDYGLIVCNPPYIPSAEIENLQVELSYEPREALDGGSDGLDFYRRIIPEVYVYLKSGGFLIMEMGFGQCAEIRMLLNSSGFEVIEVVKDYNNIYRVIVARYKS